MQASRRRLGAAAALVFAVLTLSGCHLDVEQDTLVKPDGSGTVTTTVLADKTTQDLAVQNKVDLSQILREVVGDPPSGGSVKETTEGDRFGLEVTAPFSNPDELADQVLNTDGNSIYDSFTLKGHRGGFTLDAHASTKDSPSAAEFQAEELKSSLDTRITITLPGDLKSTNADEKSTSDDGNVLTWEIPGDGEKSIQAVTGGGTSPWVFVGVIALLALVAGGVFLKVQKVKVTPLTLLALFQGLVAAGVAKVLAKRQAPSKGKEGRVVDRSQSEQRSRIERARESMEAQRQASEASSVDTPASDHPAPEVQSGWYPDPTGRNAYRWYDGTKWTEHTRNG